MHLKTVKDPTEIKLAGISIETERSDDSISAIKLTDNDGNVAVIRIDGWALKVLVPAPPKGWDKAETSV